MLVKVSFRIFLFSREYLSSFGNTEKIQSYEGKTRIERGFVNG
jgi:hypothetical protein